MAENNPPSTHRPRGRRLQFHYEPTPDVMDAATAIKRWTQLNTTQQLFNYVVLLTNRLYQHKKAGGKIMLEDARGGKEELKLL